MSDALQNYETSGTVMSNDNRPRSKTLSPRFASAAALGILALVFADVSGGHATQRGAKSFVSPERAADALAAAWRGGGAPELLDILGPAGRPLVTSGDPVAEQNARRRFAAFYDQGHRIKRGGGGEAILVIGNEDWPYPIPIVHTRVGWRFDAKAGAEQILDRRIGRDELNAIAVSRAYVEAQRDYAAKTSLQNGLPEYAQQVASTEGTHNGLYWPASAASDESPLGPLVATAEAKGYAAPPATAGGRAPYEGYYFRILMGQGAQAPGGAKSYIANGRMTGGFALVAFPAKWGDSGVMSFVVNQNGIVFEKNLGPETAKIARQIKVYDPDRTWAIVQP